MKLFIVKTKKELVHTYTPIFPLELYIPFERKKINKKTILRKKIV